VHLPAFDIAILVNGYEEDEGVNITVCCRHACISIEAESSGDRREQKLSSPADNLYFCHSSNIRFKFFFLAC